MVTFCLEYSYLVVTDHHQVVVNLTVPTVVQEGDCFFPRVTVSKPVNAGFFVYIPVTNGIATDGTARKDLDFSFAGQEILFDITIASKTTASPVRILTDDIVELNERFNIVIQFTASPSDIASLVNITNPTQTVTIIDKKGECTCMSFLQFNSLMTCIIFYVMKTFDYHLL